MADITVIDLGFKGTGSGTQRATTKKVKKGRAKKQVVNEAPTPKGNGNVVQTVQVFVNGSQKKDKKDKSSVAVQNRGFFKGNRQNQEQQLIDRTVQSFLQGMQSQSSRMSYMMGSAPNVSLRQQQFETPIKSDTTMNTPTQTENTAFTNKVSSAIPPSMDRFEQSSQQSEGFIQNQNLKDLEDAWSQYERDEQVILQQQEEWNKKTTRADTPDEIMNEGSSQSSGNVYAYTREERGKNVLYVNERPRHLVNQKQEKQEDLRSMDLDYGEGSSRQTNDQEQGYEISDQNGQRVLTFNDTPASTSDGMQQEQEQEQVEVYQEQEQEQEQEEPVNQRLAGLERLYERMFPTGQRDQWVGYRPY